MSRLVWITSATLVAGRAVADVVGVGSCGELEPRRVVALILLALLFTAGAVGFIKRGRP